jgi:hypothetical protein
MRLWFRLLVFAVLCTALQTPAPVRAAETPADPAVMALIDLFRSPADASALVAPSFASQFPPERLGGYVSFYEHTIGIPTTVVREGADYTLTSPRGSIRAAIALDAAGKIEALRFHDETSAVNADALARVLKSDRLQPAWFAYTAGRDVAIARTQKILDGLHAALGAFTRVTIRQGEYVAIFAHGETHAQISADNSGVITYLSFQQP